jgi:hypothetical protein
MGHMGKGMLILEERAVVWDENKTKKIWKISISTGDMAIKRR